MMGHYRICATHDLIAIRLVQFPIWRICVSSHHTMSTAAIVVGTLITGAANSLFTKYQDKQCVGDCGDPATAQHFNQPAFQTFQMFMGEFLVIAVYWYVYRFKQKLQAESALLLASNTPKPLSVWSFPPKYAVLASCDLIATTLLNVGLVYTPVLVYQMMRGSLVLFVAMFLVIFLRRVITRAEWASLALVALGVAIVGLSGSHKVPEIEQSGIKKSVVVGIVLIIAAELVQAVQFVVEEHILEHLDSVPLKIVYCEGAYGLVFILVATTILNYVARLMLSPEQFERSPFNIGELVSQLQANSAIVYTLVAIMALIACFNCLGISITLRVSATARLTVDTCRTLLVWAVAIFLQWEQFRALQAVGFALLVAGTLSFNGVIKPQDSKYFPQFLRD